MTNIAHHSEPGEGLEATSAPPTLVDPQDPLPESNFLWRRVFAYVIVAALLGLVGWHVGTVGAVALNGSETAISGLVELLRLMLWLVAMVATYYLLAPSAEQIIKLVQTARVLRSGVQLRTAGNASPCPAPAAPEPDAVVPVQLVEQPVPAAPEAPRDPWDKP